MRFKIKDKKTVLTDGRTTLDSKHNEKILYFKDQYNIALPQKRKELERKRIECVNLQKKYPPDDKPTNVFYLKALGRINDKIKELQENVAKLESRYDEQRYMIDVMQIMFKEDNIIASEDKATNNRNINKYVNIQKNSNKSDLMKQYMLIVDPSNYSIRPQVNYDNICNDCGSYDIISYNATLICTECGLSVNNDTTDYIPSYKEMQEINMAPKFAYKRINHFNEWLNRFQGNETTDISEEIFDKIRQDIKKYRISDSELTPIRMREILRRLGLNKQYEHDAYIINRLTGLPSHKLDPEIEAQFKIMFLEIQEPYGRHKPKGRHNCLSYSYILHKFSELLELDHLLSIFPYLKNRVKLYEHDQAWKKICEDLGWYFYPSL